MFEYTQEWELSDYIQKHFSEYFDFPLVAVEKEIFRGKQGTYGKKKGPGRKYGGTPDLIGEDSENVYLIELKRRRITGRHILQLRRYVDNYKKKTNKKVQGILAAPELSLQCINDINNEDDIVFKLLHGVVCSKFKKVKVSKKEVLRHEPTQQY